MRREKKFENVNVGDTVYFVQKLNNKFFMLPDEVVKVTKLHFETKKGEKFDKNGRNTHNHLNAYRLNDKYYGGTTVQDESEQYNLALNNQIYESTGE